LSRKDPSSLLSTAYTMVVLAVIAGWDYPSAIAKLLGKTQPTVSEQLLDLKAAGLIRTGERTKAQRYVVNWGPLMEELHRVMTVALKARRSYRKEAFWAQIELVGFERIIPTELFKEFLRRYFLELRELNGIQKTFSEICKSMFKAIDELKDGERLSLAGHYHVDPTLLKDVSALIGLEVDHVELIALQLYTDELGLKEKT
jgi:DNA-binding transcriptional ArsR family regulator